MKTFRATVRLKNLVGDDELAVRQQLVERLGSAGIEHYRVVEIALALTPTRPSKRPDPWQDPHYVPGLVMLLIAAGWALWFFSLLVE